MPRTSSTKRAPSHAVASAITGIQRVLAEIDRVRLSELVLRRRAEAIVSTLEDAPVAILVADDRARYIDVNAAATTLTGYTRSELLRMSVWDLTPERNRKLGLTLWRAFLRAGEQRGTYRLTRKDGTLVAATYFAVAHVLPNVHLSALATDALVRRQAHTIPKTTRPHRNNE
jgi:PAS domain S-box-containing protein